MEISGGGFNRFLEFFNDLSSTWTKVEFCQHYDESGFEGYDAFLRGEHELVKKSVRDMVIQQDVYRIAHSRDISMTRVRAYDEPLSAYLTQFEIHAYRADEEMGESIVVVNRGVAQSIAGGPVGDYLLFDNRRLVCLVYSQEDPATLQSAWLCENSNEIARYRQITDDLIQASQPIFENALFQVQSIADEGEK